LKLVLKDVDGRRVGCGGGYGWRISVGRGGSGSGGVVLDGGSGLSIKCKSFEWCN